MDSPSEKNRQVWDARYGREGYVFGMAPNAWLASQAHRFRPGMRVLLPADGEGRNSVWCAERGMEVEAFDLSPVGVEKAARFAKERGVQVRYAVASVEDWDWPEAVYDAVVLIFVNFATPAMRKRLFARCIKALKPGGLLLLQGYAVRQLDYGTGGPPSAEKLYTREMLEEAFAGMDILEMQDEDVELAEGKAHCGLSALMSVVAQKAA
ncbi:MAG: class I SAM-dependent methyltransferase [Alistipes senegalensis]|nr:class I SAM-dependent methyltransferase [Oxalobacter formigenes]MCM1281522.1 class I SAM-dependent methyltransferase [Alistipes senegalensis]